MKPGRYTIKELLVNREVGQIVIPEIQRDYVWHSEQVNGFLTSLLEDFKRFNSTTIEVTTDSEEIKDLFINYYKKQRYASNIGFIYAYNDPEYKGKYFLIDGQQRLTTVYLALLALCKNDQEKRKEFRKNYFHELQLKIDYKVREASHDFLKRFLDFCLESNFIFSDSNDFEFINILKAQYWYYDDYKNDKTIQSLISNYVTISKFLFSLKSTKNENGIGEIDFLNYMQNYVECWYFDTNISEQGEELYIYMNARGEQTQNNENLKADLLGTLSKNDLAKDVLRADFNETKDLLGLKNYWGKKWESWQDYFWEKRSSNESADIGFNEFIQCIGGFQYYLKKEETPQYNNTNFNSLLSLQIIESHINALRDLENNRKEFCDQYNYSEWVDNYYDLIWEQINDIKTNWFIDYKDQNKGTERNKMILLWSFFYYSNVKDESTDNNEFYRVLRFFYVRYNNFNRSVSRLKPTIDLIVKYGVISFFEDAVFKAGESEDDETDKRTRTNEELKKYTFLAQFDNNPPELALYESVIWELEDHPLNLNGKYLKNINSSHIIDYSSNPSLDAIDLIKTRFQELFPTEKPEDEGTLQNLLLHYGVYYSRVSPNYYENYLFDDWRNTIRDLSNAKKPFANFFKDYCANQNLEDLLTQKNSIFIQQHINDFGEIDNKHDQIILYSILIPDLWEYGNYIAFYGESAEKRIFKNENRIYNTQGNFRGSNHKELWEEIKTIDIKTVLKNKLKELQAL